jgi:hypothetical protein
MLIGQKYSARILCKCTNYIWYIGSQMLLTISAIPTRLIGREKIKLKEHSGSINFFHIHNKTFDTSKFTFNLLNETDSRQTIYQSYSVKFDSESNFKIYSWQNSGNNSEKFFYQLNQHYYGITTNCLHPQTSYNWWAALTDSDSFIPLTSIWILNHDIHK